MLKVLRILFIVFGILILVGTLGFMVWIIIQINALADAAPTLANPRWWVVLAAFTAAVGGMGVGFGLGIPGRAPADDRTPERPPAPVPAPAPKPERVPPTAEAEKAKPKKEKKEIPFPRLIPEKAAPEEETDILPVEESDSV